MQENHRILISTAICFFVIMAWNYFFPYNTPANLQKNAIPEGEMSSAAHKQDLISTLDDDPQTPEERVQIRADKFSGTINLKGAVIDSVFLNDYKENTELDSPKVRLLSDGDSANPYFISFNLKINRESRNIDIPQRHTKWKASSEYLTPEKPLILEWKNKQGMTFYITFYIEDDYLLRTTYSVKIAEMPHRQQPPQFIQYVNITRTINSENKQKGSSVYEGGIIVQDAKLIEASFDEIKEKNLSYKNNIDWVGFSDKYWLTAVAPTQEKMRSSKFESFNNNKKNGTKYFFIETSFAKVQAQEHQTTTISDNYLFIGPKLLEILDKYKSKYNIDLFDRAVDFGYLYFITKPLFILLVWLNNLCQNFGLAIMLLTIIVKLALLPMSYKGMKNMEKLKNINPEIQRIKEVYAGKNDLIQKHTLALYQKEKINPASGCLPILLQMPILYALYRVFSISIEMRHAPLLGWIKDLSSTDPLNIFNLFGIISWSPPHYLTVGPLAIAMAATMYIQQSMNPKPADKSQANMMAIMPVFLMVMVASFPAGLLVYWTWSNILSIFQQLMMKKLKNG